MKHFELSVHASDSSFTLDINGVYQRDQKLIVLANLKREPGASLCSTTWFSVGVEIDAPEDLPVECYLIGDAHTEKVKKAYTPITEEDARKLVNGLSPIKFTQSILDPRKVEFVRQYNEQQNKIRKKFDEIMDLIDLKAQALQAELKAQGKELEPVNPWEIKHGHSRIVKTRVDELAELNQLENKEEIQKLIDKCTLELKKLIKPKPTFMEKMERTGLSRHGLYAVAATGVAAVSLSFMGKSRP